MKIRNTRPRILMLAPFCLEQGNPEAIVNANFAKALLRRGYVVDVLTAHFHSTKYHYPLNEEADQRELGAISHPISLPHGHSFGTYWLHCYSLLKTGHIYEGCQWAGKALDAARLLQRENHYDLIISRSSPAELVALRLAQACRIPWIATWNDPYPSEKYPEPYAHGPLSPLRQGKQSLLDSVAKHADWHIFPSARLMTYMQSYFPVDIAGRSSVVPHVFGEYVSAGSGASQSAGRKCVLIHTGALLPPRFPDSLLEGLHRFVERDGVNPASFELQLVGCRSEAVSNLARRLGISQFVTQPAPMSYGDSLRAIAAAEIAVLVEADLAEGIFLPTKLVEYARCRKPILAVSPRVGTAADLFASHGGGVLAEPGSPDAIAACLSRLYASWSSGTLSREFDAFPLAQQFHESNVMPVVDGIVSALLVGSSGERCEVA